MTRSRKKLSPAPLLLLSVGMIGGAAGGCVSPNQPEVAPKVEAPVAYDEAMALRDWPVTVATYANGDTVAGPTNVTWEYDTTVASDTPSGRRRALAQVAESAIFVGNMLMLPVQLVQNPPTENRRYEGAIIPPTYSAATPIPGAEDRAEEPAEVVEPTTKPVLEGSVVPATPEAQLPSTRPTTGPVTRPTTRRSRGARS